MEMLSPFKPRLVGPVLDGTADANSAVNLHVFADSAESVAHALDLQGLSYKPYERRLKSRRDRAETYAGFEFHHGEAAVQATVFPVDGIRQAPISPIDGKPMKRADEKAVRELLQAAVGAGLGRPRSRFENRSYSVIVSASRPVRSRVPRRRYRAAAGARSSASDPRSSRASAQPSLPSGRERTSP